MRHTAAYLQRLLRDAADPAHRSTQQRFFREAIRTLGVRTPKIRAMAVAAAREYRQSRTPRPEILAIAERLWHGDAHEDRVLAILILSSFRSRLSRAEWARFDRWIDAISIWAETDGLSIYLLGPILKKEPDLIRQLRKWTRSRNHWRRRAAAVALIPVVRRGDSVDAAFCLCDRMASDRDDMVEKAVGWLLKEASRTQPQLVIEYLAANRERFSRLTLRYACEKLSQRLRRRVLG